METPTSSQEKKVAYEPPQQKPESISGTVHHLTDRRTSIVSKEGEILNASGHRDQLQRQYGLLSICGIALNINSAWIVFGGSLAISVLNGGPPGIIYEFIVAVIFYSFIAASIAELASSMPTSGGVYHWASVTAGTWGRSIGFFCGALNFFGWVFGKFPGRCTIGLERGLLTIPQYVFPLPYKFDMASVISIPANVTVQMYANYHTDFVVEPWHSFVAFVIITWLCTAFVIFCNRLIPHLQYVGMALIICGGLTTIVVVAVMPSEHASNSFVWRDFQNTTGWSDGVCFLIGVLNGAFAIDAISHLAEELPNPKVDLPKAVLAQVGLGFITALCYAISILYGINDLDAVLNSSGSFPLAEVYRQATGSEGATFGLLFIVLLNMLVCCTTTIMMVGRLFWVLARDDATPFSKLFSRVNERLSCPIPATILCAVFCTALGAIQLGSATAFNSLVGSFIILTTGSYLLAILPHLLTRRSKTPKGPFWMGDAGYVVNGIACALIIFFNIFFCFPYAYPVEPISAMNWNSVILAGVCSLTALWWLVHSRAHYAGPKLTEVYANI